MFYFVLALLIVLCLIAIVIVLLNFAVLSSGVHLVLLGWHLPGIPILLLCLFAAFVGGLLLYMVSLFSARRDAQEIRELRARVVELMSAQTRLPGNIQANFVTPAVPIPGFSPSGSLSQGPMPAGSGPLPPRQPPSSPLQNLPPGLSVPPINPQFAQPGRPGFPPPQQLPQQGGPAPRPPFFQP